MSRKETLYYDKDGNRVDNPADAARAEVTTYADDGSREKLEYFDAEPHGKTPLSLEDELAVVDRVVEQGAAVGVVIADEVRQKIRALVSKKNSRTRNS